MLPLQQYHSQHKIFDENKAEDEFLEMFKKEMQLYGVSVAPINLVALCIPRMKIKSILISFNIGLREDS